MQWICNCVYFCCLTAAERQHKYHANRNEESKAIYQYQCVRRLIKPFSFYFKNLSSPCRFIGKNQLHFWENT